MAVNGVKIAHDDPVNQTVWRTSPGARASSLAGGYCALPAGLRGILGTSVMARGSLYPDRLARRNSRSAVSSTDWPGRSSTTAATAWP